MIYDHVYCPSRHRPRLVRGLRSQRFPAPVDPRELARRAVRPGHAPGVPPGRGGVAGRRQRGPLPRPVLVDVAGGAGPRPPRHRRRVHPAGRRHRLGRADLLHDRRRRRAGRADGPLGARRPVARVPDQLRVGGDRDRDQARPPVPPPARRAASLQVHLALRLVPRGGHGRYLDRRPAPARRALLPAPPGHGQHRPADGEGRHGRGRGAPDGDRDGGPGDRRRVHRRARRDHAVHDPRRRLLAAGPRDLRRVRRPDDRRRDADRLLPDGPVLGHPALGRHA